MKQYFEWIKATPDSLPKGKTKDKLSILYKGQPDVLIFRNDKWNWFVEDGGKTTFYRVDESSWSAIEYLAPASPLPISGDVKDKILQAYKLEGNGVSLVDYTKGWQARDGEVEKLVEALKEIKDFPTYPDEIFRIASEALKPYQLSENEVK